MGLEENAVIHFLRKLDAAPFLVNYQGTQYKIGEENPPSPSTSTRSWISRI